jgi:hypothetical protein
MIILGIVLFLIISFFWCAGKAVKANEHRQAATFGRKQSAQRISDKRRLEAAEQARHNRIDALWGGRIRKENRRARRSPTAKGREEHMRTAKWYQSLADVEHSVETPRAKTQARIHPVTGEPLPGIRRSGKHK